MGHRGRGRWLPEEAVSIPHEARGGPADDVAPAAPVWAWIRTYRGDDRRVEAKAIAATADAVLIEWGSGQAATAAWVRWAAPAPSGRGCGGCRHGRCGRARGRARRGMRGQDLVGGGIVGRV